MKAFFKDIFEYHHHMNLKLIELLLKNSEKVSEKCIFWFSHSMNAHQIWNARILKTNPTVGVNDVHAIATCKTMIEENHLNTLKIIDQFDFSDNVDYHTSKGAPFSNTVQEILFQIANHYTHHRGQIMADLRQSGIEPFMSDYIFYKR